MLRRATRIGALALAGAFAGCFHGQFMLHKACRSDAECVELPCIDGFCGGPPASDSSSTSGGTSGGGGTCGDGVLDPGEECDGVPDDPAQRCVACVIKSCPFGSHLVAEAFCGEVAGDPATCLATCVPDTCGDGLVDAGEQCDDGDLDNTDACPMTCELASCGDGLVHAGVELCDDGDQDNTDACDQRCTLPTCGDAAVQPGEACDDGNLVNTDACRNTCLAAACGDGVVQAGVEACDDGDLDNSDACTNTCEAAVCGDGVVQLGGAEECDDGNADDADACLNTCQAARCGDAVVHVGVELCDDGNQDDTDACNNTCVLKSCGDAVVQAPEQCDDGDADDADACLSDCIAAGCGDGQMWAGVETCDFGPYNGAIGCVDDCAKLTPVIEIAAGIAHNCARLADGGLRCWGQNNGCQLGLGHADSIGDDEVAGVAPAVDLGDHATLEVAAGAAHTCARFEDQDVRCWGFNLFGQLGYGDFFSRACDAKSLPGALPPVSIWNGATTTRQITAGFHHTCALGENGAIRCWGLGDSGQLGLGNKQNVGVSQPPAAAPAVDVGGPAAEVRAGAYYTCARLAEGTVRCWGDNTLGQLGSGDFEKIGDDETPASKPPVALPAPAQALHVGQYHACATLEGGEIWCWGRNLSGELGQGAWSWGEASPVAVDLGELPLQLHLTTSTTCALLAEGRVRCWGTGSEGQLANGDGSSFGAGVGETAAAAPLIPFADDVSIDLLGGAGGHLCARTDYASLRCWGLNDAGQLGYGHTNSAGDDPGEVPLATDVRLFAP